MLELGDLHSADALDDQEIISGIVEIIDAENKLAAHKFALLAQFSRRGLNLKVNHSTPAHWLAAGTRVATGNAERQFATADWLAIRPTVVDALAVGDIHSAHVKEIFDGYNHITTAHPALGADEITEAMADLLAVAFERTAHDVKSRAHEIAHNLAEQARARYEKARREHEAREQARREREKHSSNQDEPEDDSPDDSPEDDLESLLGRPPIPVSENADLNTLEMHLQANGRTVLRGDFDKTLAEKLRSSIAEFSRPVPEPDGTRDPRSARKRNADGLSQVLDGSRGTSHGSPARVVVTVNLRDLLADATFARDMGDPDWPFRLLWTGPISGSLARLLACDADLNPIIVDDNDVPLAMGRSVRLAEPHQRAAVTVRDRCCVKCGKAAQFCVVHHIRYWNMGGRTDLDNLVLLCGDCHHDIHDREWEVAMGEDGHPFVTPPATFDPERKPMPSYHRRRKPAA